MNINVFMTHVILYGDSQVLEMHRTSCLLVVACIVTLSDTRYKFEYRICIKVTFKSSQV